MDFIRELARQSGYTGCLAPVYQKGRRKAMKDRLDKYQKQFDQLVAKLKETDENIVKLQAFRNQVVEEINITKGRFNEVKELIEEQENAAAVK